MEPVSAHIERIRILPLQAEPELTYILPAKGWFAGMQRGTMKGFLRGNEVGTRMTDIVFNSKQPTCRGKGCGQARLFLLAMALAARVTGPPVGAAVGGLFGTFMAESASQVEASEQTLKAVIGQLRIADGLAAQILLLAVQQTPHDVALVQGDSLGSGDADTVLQVRVKEVGLVGDEDEVNPQLGIRLTVLTEMRAGSNYKEIDSRYFSVVSGQQPLSRWTEQSGQRFIDELDQLNPMVGQQIVDELLGDPRNMIEAANRVLGKNSEQITAWASRGAAKVKIEDYQGAVEDLDRAIAINGMISNHYLWRARARYFLHDYHGSIEDYDLVIGLGSPNIDPRWLIGRAAGKARLGDLDGAIEDCTQAINLDDKLQDGYLVRATLYLLTGYFGGAGSDLLIANHLETPDGHEPFRYEPYYDYFNPRDETLTHLALPK